MGLTMKQHKRYEVSFHARTITVYVGGVLSHVISFQEALAYQRNIVRLLLASLDRNGFEMVNPTAEGAWVYEGYGL